MELLSQSENGQLEANGPADVPSLFATRASLGWVQFQRGMSIPWLVFSSLLNVSSTPSAACLSHSSTIYLRLSRTALFPLFQLDHFQFNATTTPNSYKAPTTLHSYSTMSSPRKGNKFTVGSPSALATSPPSTGFAQRPRSKTLATKPYIRVAVSVVTSVSIYHCSG